MPYALFSNVLFGRLFSTPERPFRLSQTPSRRPPHVTGRLLNTVPRVGRSPLGTRPVQSS